jgi:hypothetical protein
MWPLTPALDRSQHIAVVIFLVAPLGYLIAAAWFAFFFLVFQPMLKERDRARRDGAVGILQLVAAESGLLVMFTTVGIIYEALSRL